MRNSLIYKLLGAFLLVVVIGSLVISILLVRATREAFTRYSNRSGQVLATRLASRLADFYRSTGSWQGVGDYLQLDQWTEIGINQNRGMGMGRMMLGSGIIAGLDLRLMLADENGVVIADSRNESLGQKLDQLELNRGIAVVVDGSRAGTVLAAPETIGGAPAREFLTSVNAAIFKSMVVAGIIALFLGSLLFIQITAPLRQLQKAAGSIADGDLSTRVDVKSNDELGDLAYSFNNMAESLADAESQRKQLAADVAHELRTPLAAIQATLEGMQDGVLPANQEQIASLHSETLLLNRMVDDLRLLSQAEAGKLAMAFRPVSPGPLVRRVIDQFQPLALQQKVDLEMEIQDDLPEIRADSDRIAQVMNNLVSNALHYTPGSGKIHVYVRKELSENSVVFSVADTGPGISAGDLPNVFNRFYRADKSRSRVSGGSGLGLSIVKQLVEAHGGNVTAESPVFPEDGQPQIGTRFTFTIPAV
jgi:signal transduction histidine kinase